MGCEVVNGPDFSAIICSRGRRSTRRCICGSPNVLYQCDAPVATRKFGTCDANLCEKCRTRVGDNLDYCPKHVEATKVVAPELPLFQRCGNCGEVLSDHADGRYCPRRAGAVAPISTIQLFRPPPAVHHLDGGPDHARTLAAIRSCEICVGAEYPSARATSYREEFGEDWQG